MTQETLEYRTVSIPRSCITIAENRTQYENRAHPRFEDLSTEAVLACTALQYAYLLRTHRIQPGSVACDFEQPTTNIELPMKPTSWDFIRIAAAQEYTARGMSENPVSEIQLDHFFAIALQCLAERPNDSRATHNTLIIPGKKAA